MSFLTTLISSFPLLSYLLHHLTLSSSHSIHLFILTTFHVFSHHLICITLITSHIHLSFIPHHPHSILLPFHHSRIFHFSTHPFHRGALRDFLKTHFQPFYLSYPPIHYSIVVSFLFQLHHPHHYTSRLSILIRIYVVYTFISIHYHPILPLSHFYHTHSYPFPFQSSHSISSFPHIQCSVYRKHSWLIRRTCFCLWWLIREQWHQMMRKYDIMYLKIGGKRCTGSRTNGIRFHWMAVEEYLHQSNAKSILSRITDPIT